MFKLIFRTLAWQDVSLVAEKFPLGVFLGVLLSFFVCDLEKEVDFKGTEGVPIIWEFEVFGGVGSEVSVWVPIVLVLFG